MQTKRSSNTIAYIVPTLAEIAAQREDVIQILLAAAAQVEQALDQPDEYPLYITLVVVDRDISGWPKVARIFSRRALDYVSVQVLEAPSTPNLAIAGHKPAYELFEWLKLRHFDAVHALDRNGLLFYPTQAKHLGLYFLNTIFAVHVVGSTLFWVEASDALVDNLAQMMDDMLERGATERADVIYVHDTKAWAWYANKIKAPAAQLIYDLAWPCAGHQKPEYVAHRPDQPLALTFYGTLGSDSGLPFFCDLVGRVLPEINEPVEVFFIGAAQPVGGMDAVSYIHLRSAKWAVPVTIKRDLAIVDEIEYIHSLGGIVVVHTARREGLRARLIAGANVTLVQVNHTPGSDASGTSKGYSAVPGQVAHVLTKLISSAATRILPPEQQHIVGLWSSFRSSLPVLKAGSSVAPLELQEPQPRVTVCVTHFSRPHKLRVALASLRAQTYRNFEVIVVDDGSPDLQVQQELEAIRKEIAPLGWRILVQENRYLGAARNVGARHARGDYLLFMDDDNAATPEELTTLVAVAQRTGAAIVTTFYNAFVHDDDLNNPIPTLRFTPFGADPTLGILTNCFGDANALYERQVFERLGGFTEDYGITHEDWEFFCRAALEGVALICVPEPLFWYRIDNAGMYRGEQTLLHKGANLRRHIRPFLQKLPAYQARLVQLTQGLASELPLITVGDATRTAIPQALRSPSSLPYARVAVITRTKDRPLLLRRAIRSVLDQTFRDWLLVIVNDGGDPEDVMFVVDSFADELKDRVLVLHHPISLGMQTAANAGLSSCESDFLIIHDDDDSWEQTFLARTVSHLDERGWNARSGGVVTWSRVVVEALNENGQIQTQDSFIFNANLHHLSLIDLAIENRFPPISFLFRRAALEVVGPFREQYGVLGDWDFHLRVLQQFDIDVIPEPLANYHHRTKNSSGVYGNSVHVQTELHRAKRVELLNDMMRGQASARDGISLPQLMAFGDIQQNLLSEQRREFQRLHDYIWTLEQRIKYISEQGAVVPQQNEFQRLHDYIWTLEQRIKYISATVEPSYGNTGTLARSRLNNAHNANPAPTQKRNLVFNGDFQVWPGIYKTYQGPEGTYSYAEVSPDVHISYDGCPLTLSVERDIWSEGGQLIPFGKPFIHIEYEGRAQHSSWFTLEYNIPSVRLLAGRQICISAISQLQGTQAPIHIGGRYDFGPNRTLVWPTQTIHVGTDMSYWACTISCPAVHTGEFQHGQRTRILFQLPGEGHFSFDLTNLQIEFGAVATEFQYCALPLWRRLGLLWKKTKRGLKQMQSAVAAPVTSRVQE